MRRSNIIFLLALLFCACDPGPYKRAMDYNTTGVLYFQQGNDSALYYFNKAIQTDSSFQPAIQNKVNYHISKKEFEEALQSIELLLQNYPYIEALQIKGMLLDVMQRPKEASASYLQALDAINAQILSVKQERKSSYLYNLGFTYFLLNDTAKAKKLITEHINSSDNMQLTDSILHNLGSREKIIVSILNSTSP